MDKELLSVVLPLYKTERAVRELLFRLHTSLADQSFEILGVDDGSPDSSGAVLKTAAAELGIQCTVLKHDTNIGQHASIIAGLRAAQGDIFVVMDADLQDPPEFVPVLIERLRQTRAGVVFARRCGNHQSWLEGLSSSVLKALVLRMMDSDLPPQIGLFVCLSGPARQRLLELPLARPWVFAMLLALRLPLAYVDYERLARPSPSSYTLYARLRLAWRALAVTLKVRRLKLES